MEKYLPTQGAYDSQFCFSDRREKAGTENLDAAGKRAEQKNPKIACAKFIVQSGAVAKYPQNLMRKKLEDTKSTDRNKCYDFGSSPKGFFYPTMISCAVIIAE